MRYTLTSLIAALLLALPSAHAAASALNGEVFVAVGTTGTNALPASRTTNTTVLVQSTAGDGTNAFRVNTTITHTSGNLIEVRNNGTNTMRLDAYGELDLFGEFSGFELNDGASKVQIYAIGELSIKPGNVTRTAIRPASGDGVTPYQYDTSEAHTSGFIVEVYNNSTNRFSVSAAPAAGESPLYLWDPDNGTLQQVTYGVADSGGSGFRLLRIPNAP